MTSFVMKRYVLGGLLVLLCSCTSHSKFEVEPLLDYCEGQVKKSIHGIVPLFMIGQVAFGPEYFGMRMSILMMQR